MKSKICLCNGTILKKDLTRFAPMVLVTGLILWAFGALLKNMEDYLLAGEVNENYLTATTVLGMAMAVMLGLISAVGLFGYLTKKQECDYIHALPIRRETLFFTKISVAFLQFVVPFGVFFAFFPGSRGWGFQMLAAFCSWLFTFGLAAFSMMLAGRRLAGYILFYLICGLGSTVYAVVEAVYLPLLPGVYFGGMMTTDLSPFGHLLSLDFVQGTLRELLVPLILYGLAGVGFLVAALVCYRKRKLERAGDFLAAKWLEPVFAWGFGIYISIFPIAIAYMIDGSVWIALIIGLTIGYFAARMLFARSIKVFGRKNLLGFGALVAVMAASVYITSLDPLGLVTRVPETDRIESVTLCDNEYTYARVYGMEELATGAYTTSDPAEIEELRQLHKNLIGQEEPDFLDSLMEFDNQIHLVYELKGGRKLQRTYYALQGQELKQMKYYLSQPEALLGTADIEELLDSIEELYAYGVNGGTIHTQRAFLEVFMAECEAGWMYTPDYEGMSDWTISIDIGNEDGTVRDLYIDVPLTAQKTITWLENYFADQDNGEMP